MDDLTGQKVVIISDLHLGKRFKPNKYGAILSAIDGADRLILNGDIWEGAAINFEQFLNSPWQKLFPLFKSKKAVYLYGNHDQKKFVDGRSQVFCDQATKEYSFSQNNVIFHLQHGDELLATTDQRLPNYPYWVFAFVFWFETKMIKLLGKPLSQIIYKDNQRMVKWKVTHLSTEEWLVCGDSHAAVLDQKNRFANSGVFEIPVASYIKVENGQPELIFM